MKYSVTPACAGGSLSLSLHTRSATVLWGSGRRAVGLGAAGGARAHCGHEGHGGGVGGGRPDEAAGDRRVVGRGDEDGLAQRVGVRAPPRRGRGHLGAAALRGTDLG